MSNNWYVISPMETKYTVLLYDLFIYYYTRQYKVVLGVLGRKNNVTHYTITLIVFL